MEEKTVCYWKFIGNRFLKDTIQILKWVLVVGTFTAGAVFAFFAGPWIAAGILAWISSSGTIMLWVIIALYILTTLALKLYQGAPSDCAISWAIGLFIAICALLITKGTESPLPVLELATLVIWGPVLFGMRYAWLMHTEAVRFCEEQEEIISQEALAAARVDRGMV